MKDATNRSVAGHQLTESRKVQPTPLTVAHPSVIVPIRRLFRHFVQTGLLPANPFETPHSRKMQVAGRVRRLCLASPPEGDSEIDNRNRHELRATRSRAWAYVQHYGSDDRVGESSLNGTVCNRHDGRLLL